MLKFFKEISRFFLNNYQTVSLGIHFDIIETASFCNVISKYWDKTSAQKLLFQNIGVV